MGISYVDGICQVWYSCVLIEFGPTDERDRTYPSTGFGSVIVAAHELAHNLGVSHVSLKTKQERRKEERAFLDPSALGLWLQKRPLRPVQVHHGGNHERKGEKAKGRKRKKSLLKITVKLSIPGPFRLVPLQH